MVIQITFSFPAWFLHPNMVIANGAYELPQLPLKPNTLKGEEIVFFLNKDPRGLKARPPERRKREG